MSLSEAGVVLEARNYDAHVKALRDLNKLYKDTFNPVNFKSYNDALKQMEQTAKELPKVFPKQLPLPKPDQAKEVQAALELLGKSGKYAISQISEETLKLNSALAALKKSGQFQVQALKPPEIKSDKLKELTKGLDESLTAGNGFNNFIGKAVGNVDDLTGMLGGMIAKFTVVAGVIKLVNDTIQFFNSSVAIAQRNETLSVSLREIGSQAGYSNKQIELATKLLTKQGVTTQAAQQSLLRMARANISWAEASKLAAIAQGSAVVAGINSSAAFERLVTGIQKMEPELLDELGITLNRTKAYEKFGAAIGKNSKNLTDAEKQQAILNEIYRQSESVLGVYGAAMETSGKKQASLARYIEETQNNVGKLMLGFAGASVDLQTGFWKAMQQITKGLADFAPLFNDIPSGFGTFIERMQIPSDVRTAYDAMAETLVKMGIKSSDAADMTRKLADELNKGRDPASIINDLAKYYETLGLNSQAAANKAALVVKVLLENQDKLKSIPKSFDFWEELAKGAFNFTRIAGVGFVAFVTIIEVSAKKIKDNIFNLISIFDAMTKAANPVYMVKGMQDMRAILEGTTASTKTFSEELQSNLLGFYSKYPDLAKTWEEANKDVEGSSEDLRLAQDNLAGSVEDVTEAVENQVSALENTKDAYSKAKSIQENYQNAQAKAKEEYEKGLAQAEAKYQEERAKKIAEFNKKLADFDADNARKRAKMIDDFEFGQANRAKEFSLQRQQAEASYNLQANQAKRKFYDDQKRALRDFNLSMAQEQRRNQINDRRLRADGDVLALMEAREDAALQQQEAVENFNNQQQTAKENFDEQQRVASENFRLQEEQARQSFALQTEIQREEFQRRLAEFDENVALQREKMIEAHAQELVDLQTKFEEEKVKLYENYQEKLAMAEEQKNKELQALGDSLKEQGNVTEEGMKEIASKISEVFGDDGAGDQLIKGWSERSESEFNNLIDNLTTQIDRLKEQMKSASEAVSGASGGSAGGGHPSTTGGAAAGFGNNPSTISTNQKPIGARSGFNGIVTGPKTFQIEPGMREHVAITPMPRMGGRVELGGTASVNVTGLSQSVGADVEARIASTIVDEIRVAVKRLNRRGV